MSHRLQLNIVDNKKLPFLWTENYKDKNNIGTLNPLEIASK